MRGVARPVGKLPASNQPPNVMLSKELVSPSDIKFVSLPPLLLLCRSLCVISADFCVPLLSIDIRSYRSSQPCREQYGDKERRTPGSTVFSSLNKTLWFSSLCILIYIIVVP